MGNMKKTMKKAVSNKTAPAYKKAMPAMPMKTKKSSMNRKKGM
jgi:hypothetical protein